MKNIILSILVGLMFIAITGLLCERLGLYQDGYDIGWKDGYGHIKTTRERQIQCRTTPDGIWGEKSEKAYHLAYGQQSANVWINPKSMGIEK